MFFKVPSSQIIPWCHRHDPADCKHVRTRLQPRAVSVTQLWPCVPYLECHRAQTASGRAGNGTGAPSAPSPLRCSQSHRPRDLPSGQPCPSPRQRPDQLRFPQAGYPARSRRPAEMCPGSKGWTGGGAAGTPGGTTGSSVQSQGKVVFLKTLKV